MKISPARKATFEILQKIEKEKAFSSILLPVYEDKLSPKDRSLCHKLTLGVLRNKLYLDFIIENLTRKKLNKFDLEVINSLRIGIYQLLFLEKIPTYSAINESVNLVKFAKKKSASGLVNAVLRRVSRNEFDLKYKNEFEKISIETSHPTWLLEKWIEQYGLETTKKIALSNNQTPKIAFRFTTKFYKQKSEKEQTKIKENLLSDSAVNESPILDGAYISDKTNEKIRELNDDRFIYFQDIGSQIIADLVKTNSEGKFLDLCAAPGSKTTYIASKNYLHNSKLTLFAGDFFQHRVRSLKGNIAAQDCDLINLIRYDATKSLPFSENSFNVILIDAPCSGTGTIKHNPEIRFRLKKDDFISLQKKQLQILDNASKIISLDGEIIYSTCSLEKEENEEVIDLFLDKNQNFEKKLPNLRNEFLIDDKFGKILPHKYESDGFFIAALRRIN